MTHSGRPKQITEREGRILRLLFLSGRSVVAMAPQIHRTREAVCRYMARHDLRRPEAPLERHALVLDIAADLQAEAVAVAAAMAIRLAGEARRLRAAGGGDGDASWLEAIEAQQAAVREVAADLASEYEAKCAGLDRGRAPTGGRPARAK
jgi:hypothetical protein